MDATSFPTDSVINFLENRLYLTIPLSWMRTMVMRITYLQYHTLLEEAVLPVWGSSDSSSVLL